jgi:hypothetical protein
VYTTLMESDVVESDGHSEGVTGSGRTHKKPKDLSSQGLVGLGRNQRT